MKIAVLGLAAASALLLAGCSGSSDDGHTAAPTTAPTSTAVADAGTSTPNPTIGNLADPLCAAAQANIEDATNLESKTSGLTTMLQDPTFLTSDDPSDLNAWGNDMLTLSASAKSFYDVGVEQTQGEDVNADFATLSTFVDKYTMALAQTAADATSNAAFVTSIQTLFASDEMTAAAQAAPPAALSVSDYLGTRCNIAN